MGWAIFFSFVTALFTMVVAALTFLVWRTYERLAFFTGAMESQSELMLRLRAQELNIKVIAWDPTLEPSPVPRTHGTEMKIETIRIAISRASRAQQPTWREKFQYWIS